MSSPSFKRKLLRLGHDRHSIAVTLPKTLVDFLQDQGFDLSDSATIELNKVLINHAELVLRLSRAKN